MTTEEASKSLTRKWDEVLTELWNWAAGIVGAINNQAERIVELEKRLERLERERGREASDG
jgi:hypothetical protein